MSDSTMDVAPVEPVAQAATPGKKAARAGKKAKAADKGPKKGAAVAKDSGPKAKARAKAKPRARTARAPAPEEVSAIVAGEGIGPAPDVQVFSTLSDRVGDIIRSFSAGARVQAIMLLAHHGVLNVGDLVDRMCVATGRTYTQPTVSHHLAILKMAGIVVTARDGKCQLYRLTERGIGFAGIIADIAANLEDG